MTEPYRTVPSLNAEVVQITDQCKTLI